MTRTRIGVVIALVSGLGCSGDKADGEHGDGAWTSGTSWTIAETPKFELHGKTVDENPLDPVSVLRVSGAYLVPDGSANGSQCVLVYDDSGRYVGAWGRMGPGPGEFALLNGWSGLFRGDSVAVQDAGGNEIEVFSATGVHGRAIKLPLRGPLLRLFPNGNVMLSSTRIPNVKDSLAVAIYGPNNELVRVVHAFPLPPATRGFTDPYVGPRPTLAAGKEHLYYTNGIDFAVDVYDTLGHQVRTLRRPLPRIPMTAKDKEEIIQQIVGEYRQRPDGKQVATEFEKILRTGGRWSEYLIAWGNVLEDADGNVWLEHYRSIYPHIERTDARKTTWSVFDPVGRFLGEIAIPARVTVANVAHGELYGIWLDESDVKHVQVYPLTKPDARK